MRHDEPDEPDRATYGGGGAAQEDCRECCGGACQGDALAKAGCDLVAERQGIQSPRRQEGEEDAANEEGRDFTYCPEGCPADTADPPGLDASGNVRAWQG
jgi:hypothetical protein